MKAQNLRKCLWLLAATYSFSEAQAAEFDFRHHFVERTLPVRDKLVGDYGLTALADIDRDGDLDICPKAWGPRPWNGNGGNGHADFRENLLKKPKR